jgi:formylglycine-generating enzyme required for sulfatase activity
LIQSISNEIQIKDFKPYLNEYSTINPILGSNQKLYPHIPGKIIVINKENNDFDDIYFELPEELKANNPGEVGTIVSISCSDSAYGKYTNGAIGYQKMCRSVVIDKKNNLVLYDKGFWGEKPPTTKSAGGDWYGSRPDSEIINYIKTFKINLSMVNGNNSILSNNEQKQQNTIDMEFIFISSGEFNMGSSSNENYRSNNEGPVHQVKISNAFYLGKYEVTQKQWRDVMGTNPSYFESDNLPVESVSWNDVQDFIKKLNEKEGGNKYRLPTEAEWEYAARAGTTTSYSFGDDVSKLGKYAWYDENGMRTEPVHKVGQKKPNLWGLYDMHGNVLEWVQDKWHEDYNGAPTDGSSWESGDDSDRVVRGCSWMDAEYHCRSAYRDKYEPSDLPFNLGFRLLRIS